MKHSYKRFFELKGVCYEDSFIKIEEEIKKLYFVKSIIVNPLNLRLIIEFDNKINYTQFLTKIEKIISGIDSNIEINEIMNNEIDYSKLSDDDNNLYEYKNSPLEDGIENNNTCKVKNYKNEKIFIRNLNINKASKFKVYTMVIGLLLVLYAVLSGMSNTYSVLFISYFLIESKVILSELNNLFKNKELEEKLVIVIIFCVIYIMGYHLSAICIILSFELMRLFQAKQVNKINDFFKEMVNINLNPSYFLSNEDNNKIVEKEQFKYEDIIILKDQEIIPIDGIVIDGVAKVDISNFSGGLEEILVKQRDKVFAGWKVQSGSLEVKVLKSIDETFITKCLNHLRSTMDFVSNSKYTLNLKNRYIILILTLIFSFAIYLLTLKGINSKYVFFKILIVLILCAPSYLIKIISVFKSLGLILAFKKGILIKDDTIFRDFKKIESMVLSKTNVLTYGNKDVSKIIPYGYINEDLILEYATYAELNSKGSLSKTILDEFKKRYPNTIIDTSRITSFEEFAGMGVKIYLGDRYIFVGNHYLMNMYDIDYKPAEDVGTILYVAINKNNIGYIVINDSLKEESPSAISELKRNGIKNIVLITGDNYNYSNYLGQVLNIDNIYSEILPKDKLSLLRKIRSSLRRGSKLAIVENSNLTQKTEGDDVNITLNGCDNDNIIEERNFVIMSNNPTKISEAFQIFKIIKKKIISAIAIFTIYKITIISLFFLGIINLWMTIASDTIIAFIILINISKRSLLYVKKDDLIFEDN